MEFHHYIHFDNAETNNLLHKILNNQSKIMADLKAIQDQNDALIAAVQAEDAGIDSAITLINGFGAILQGIKDQLATAIANGLDPVAEQAVVDSLGNTIADVNSKKDVLAAAVAAAPTA